MLKYIEALALNLTALSLYVLNSLLYKGKEIKHNPFLKCIIFFSFLSLSEHDDDDDEFNVLHSRITL